MTSIYKKVGRRYKEIGVCENEAFYYPHGATLVWASKGSTLTKYGIEPADAALLAAAERVRDSMMDAMRKATELKPIGTNKRALTRLERKAWAAYVAIAGSVSSLQLEGASMHDVVDAGVKALVEACKKDAKHV